MRDCLKALKGQYGFRVLGELHTKALLTDKNPHRNCEWKQGQKREILIAVTKCIGDFEAKIIIVIIDKTQFRDENYRVLEMPWHTTFSALKTTAKGSGIKSS